MEKLKLDDITPKESHDCSCSSDNSPNASNMPVFLKLQDLDKFKHPIT